MIRGKNQWVPGPLNGYHDSLSEPTCDLIKAFNGTIDRDSEDASDFLAFV